MAIRIGPDGTIIRGENNDSGAGTGRAAISSGMHVEADGTLIRDENRDSGVGIGGSPALTPNPNTGNSRIRGRRSSSLPSGGKIVLSLFAAATVFYVFYSNLPLITDSDLQGHTSVYTLSTQGFNPVVYIDKEVKRPNAKFKEESSIEVNNFHFSSTDKTLTFAWRCYPGAFEKVDKKREETLVRFDVTVISSNGTRYEYTQGFKSTGYEAVRLASARFVLGPSGWVENFKIRLPSHFFSQNGIYGIILRNKGDKIASLTVNIGSSQTNRTKTAQEIGTTILNNVSVNAGNNDASLQRGNTQVQTASLLPFDGWFEGVDGEPTLKDTVTVKGWAVYGAENDIEVFANNQSLGLAKRVVRDDVLAVTKRDGRDYSKSTPLPGFEIQWNTKNFADGRYLLSFIIKGKNGISSGAGLYTGVSRDRWVIVNNGDIEYFRSTEVQQNLILLPKDAFQFGEHYYKVFKESIKWTTAAQNCERIGGYLATITSDAEYNFVLRLLSSQKKLYWLLWLGASDRTREGRWQWMTDEPFIFTKWLPNEPNGGMSENYLILTNLYYNQWGWNDGTIDYANGYICEWDAGRVTSSSTPNAENISTALEGSSNIGTSDSVPTKIGYINANNVYIRPSPKRVGGKIFFQNNDIVKILEYRVTDGEPWLCVEGKGEKGWVHSDLVTRSTPGTPAKPQTSSTATGIRPNAYSSSSTLFGPFLLRK